MGSAASMSGESLLAKELAKPLDGRDVSEENAKAEVCAEIQSRFRKESTKRAQHHSTHSHALNTTCTSLVKQVARLRGILRQHEQELLSLGKCTPAKTGNNKRASLPTALTVLDTAATNRSWDLKSPSIKSPYSRADMKKFDNADAQNFQLCDAPQLKDYLANEYARFSGVDQMLEWDEFWRFMHDLELGLSDQEIVALRQKADINRDGVVEWDEMISVVEPLLGKYWQASLAGAPEYTHWTELHWETHHIVKKDHEGYTRKGIPFYVNKLTGENTWHKPKILERHASLEEMKKRRSCSLAPSLVEVLSHAFTKHSSCGQVLTKAQFWKVVTEELHLDPALTPAEMTKLMAQVDVDRDGLVDWHEFVAALSPKLAHVFQERKGSNEWVAITYYHEDDGKEYLYWYNRVTGKSTWENPAAKRKSTTGKRGSLAAPSSRGASANCRSNARNPTF